MRRPRTTTKKLKNLKMDQDVYVLRRRVIDLIYELKRDIDLPRIEVRITESHKEILGVGTVSGRVIWITLETALSDYKTFFHVVCHELGHAVFGLRHDETCPLMASQVNPYKLCNKETAIKILKQAAQKEAA